MKLQNILRMAVPVVLVMCSTLQIAQADDLSCFDVNCGPSQYDFNSTPIDANFFYEGSDAFKGIVLLNGGNTPGPDTRIERLAFGYRMNELVIEPECVHEPAITC